MSFAHWLGGQRFALYYVCPDVCDLKAGAATPYFIPAPVGAAHMQPGLLRLQESMAGKERSYSREGATPTM